MKIQTRENSPNFVGFVSGVDLKKELNSEIENYKIQIFNGNRDEAENTISEYKILYNEKINDNCWL